MNQTLKKSMYGISHMQMGTSGFLQKTLIPKELALVILRL